MSTDGRDVSGLTDQFSQLNTTSSGISSGGPRSQTETKSGSGSGSTGSSGSTPTFAIAERPNMDKFPFTKTQVLTNYYKLHIGVGPKNVYQYSVVITVQGKTLIKREKCRPIFWQVVETNPDIFPDRTKIVYNDVNIFWSCEQVRLPTPTYMFQAGRGRYDVEVKPTSGLVLDINGPDPTTSISFLDSLMSQRIRCPLEPDNKLFVTHGHSSFLVPSNPEEERTYAKEVGLSLEALTGLHSAIKPLCQDGILLNCDVSHSVFKRRNWNLVDVVIEVAKSLGSRGINRSNLHTVGFGTQQRGLIHKLLKSSILMTTYKVRDKNQYMKFVRICDKAANACMISVTQPEDDRPTDMSVAEYFERFRNIQLQYPFLPVVQVGKKERDIFIPMELLATSNEPDRLVGQLPDRERAQFIRSIQQPPNIRLQYITELTARNGLQGDAWTRHYQLSISDNLIPAPAYLLPKPVLEFGRLRDTAPSTFKQLPGEKGSWELLSTTKSNDYKKVDFCRVLKKPKKYIFGLIVVRPMRYDPRRHLENLQALEMSNMAFGLDVIPTKKDVHFGDEWEPEPQGREEDWEPAQRLLALVKSFKQFVIKNFGDDVLPILLCVMPRKQAATYSIIKYVCECEIGVYVQCVLQKIFEVVQGNANNATAHNLTLKINAKLGGTHYQINDDKFNSWKNLTDPKSPTLFLGVDVTHPGAQEKAEMKKSQYRFFPSIASIVGNIDIECTIWQLSTKVQQPTQEMVVHSVNQVQERINAFIKNNNGLKPSQIVVYRDGVSETEYKKVMTEELTSVKSAIRALDDRWDPKVVYIATQKRHHTRFFQLEKPLENVKPGTLVQDVVASRNYFDFYLSSHFGTLGTSRPTHYVVLYDELKPKPATWQTVTFALCFLYYRTPKAVSLPAPIFYAHLAARRSRYHWDAATTLYQRDRNESDLDYCERIVGKIRFHESIRDRGMHFC